MYVCVSLHFQFGIHPIQSSSLTVQIGSLEKKLKIGYYLLNRLQKFLGNFYIPIKKHVTINPSSLAYLNNGCSMPL